MKRVTALFVLLLVFCHVTLVAQTTTVTEKSTKTPWSSQYYPLLNGPLHRGYLGGEDAPLVKYDKYVGTVASAPWNKLNRKGTQIWEGYCHAWAAAAVLEPEPQYSVYGNDTVFRVGDLKGILLEAYDAPISGAWEGHRFGSRHSDGTICNHTDEIAPSKFELWLTWWVGGGRQGGAKTAFVMDKDSGIQVWNHPIHEYKLTKTKVVTPNGWKKKVTAEIHYATEFNDYDKAGTSSPVVSYFYNLEDTDGDNKVDRSYWTGSSVGNSPDFLWNPVGRYEPKNYNRNPRVRPINPHVDYQTVKKIMALPKVGLFVPDNAGDRGIEPSKGKIWESPSLSAAPTAFQPGNKIKLKATVRNESGLDAKKVNVAFFHSFASLGTGANNGRLIAAKPDVKIGYYNHTEVAVDWVVPRTKSRRCVGVTVSSSDDPVSAASLSPSSDNNVAARNFFVAQVIHSTGFSDFGFSVPNTVNEVLNTVLEAELAIGQPGWTLELFRNENDLVTRFALDEPGEPVPFFSTPVEPETAPEYFVRLIPPEGNAVGDSAIFVFRSAMSSLGGSELVATNGVTLEVNIIDEEQLDPDFSLRIRAEADELEPAGALSIDLENRAALASLEFDLVGEPGTFFVVEAATTDRAPEFDVEVEPSENGATLRLIPQTERAVIETGEGAILELHYESDQVENLAIDAVAATTEDGEAVGVEIRSEGVRVLH